MKYGVRSTKYDVRCGVVYAGEAVNVRFYSYCFYVRCTKYDVRCVRSVCWESGEGAFLFIPVFMLDVRSTMYDVCVVYVGEAANVRFYSYCFMLDVRSTMYDVCIAYVWKAVNVHIYSFLVYVKCMMYDMCYIDDFYILFLVHHFLFSEKAGSAYRFLHLLFTGMAPAPISTIYTSCFNRNHSYPALRKPLPTRTYF
jgi:hypothetical protein